eukprot:6798142-Pyramimonas_sp.AAC.1
MVAAGSGGLIEFVAPVCGLNDAPLSCGAERLLTFSVVYGSNLKSRRWNPASGFGEPRMAPALSTILIEVDDLIVASHPRERESLREKLESIFHFGAWEIGESDFAGRH